MSDASWYKRLLEKKEDQNIFDQRTQDPSFRIIEHGFPSSHHEHTGNYIDLKG